MLIITDFLRDETYVGDLDKIDGITAQEESKLPRTEFETNKRRSRLLTRQRERFFRISSPEPHDTSTGIRNSEPIIFSSGEASFEAEPSSPNIFESLFRARSRKAIYASTPTLVNFQHNPSFDYNKVSF